MTGGIAGGTGEQDGDVLASGDDRPRWRPGRRTTVLAAVAALLTATVLAATALVRHERAEAARVARAAAAADVLRLSVGNGQGLPRHGARPRGGLHLQLRNDGPRPVHLVSARLSPGGWQLHLEGPTVLGPGASQVFRLARGGACSSLAELRTSYRVLLVEAVVASGRRRTTAVDLTSAPLAYGGELAEALRSPELACSPAAAGAR